MRIDRFTIQRAQSLNNFQPGGKEWWIVYLHGDEKKPCLFETLETACRWMKDMAIPEPLCHEKYKTLKRMEDTTWLGN